MTKKLLSITFLCLVFMAFAQAQNAKLKGIITDQSTKEPLIGATIMAGNTGTTTDYNGNFELNLDPGSYTVEIRYVGYQKYTEEIVIKDGQTYEMEVSMEAQTNILNTATVTSGKFEKELGEVTVSLEVLKPDLIDNTNKPQLDKAIEKLPGVTIIDGQANIRGGSGYSQGAGSRVLLLVDDVPILQPDAQFPNWDDVPIENVAQIEVLKGAASALYGTSALNGIVNVRTAYAKSEPETNLSAFYTHYFSPQDGDKKWWDDAPYTSGLSAVHRRKMGKVDLVLGGYYFNEQSFNKGFFKKYGRFNVGTRYRVNERLTVGLNANVNTGTSGSFFYWESPENAHVGDSTTLATRERIRYNIDPNITYYDNGGNKHKFQGRFLRVNNDNSGNQSNISSSYYGEYQFQRKLDEWDGVVTAGLVALSSDITAELYGDTTFTSQNYGAYLQYDQTLFDRLNLSFGARYEYNELNNPGFQVNSDEIEPSNEEDGRVVFRAGANLRVADYTFLRASWGQGYRYPSVAEKFIFTQAGAIQILPNPDLEFETGWSAELGLKQGFQLPGFQGFIDVAAFISQYDNMIEFNFGLWPYGFGFSAVNIGGTEIRGAEVTIAGKGKIGEVDYSTLMGYTYVDPQFMEFDTTIGSVFDESIGQRNSRLSSEPKTNILKYRSQHLFKFDIEFTYRKFSLGIESFYNSHIVAIDDILEGVVPGLGAYRDENNNGFLIISGRAAYQITDEIKASLIMENITNQEYSRRPGLLDAPRNLTMRVDYRF